MKDEFLATVSHELRSPLSAILGWTFVLRRAKGDSTEMKNGLDTIERNARAQAQLIEDLLDMSRITSGKVRLDIQPVEPATFVEAALATIRPAAAAKEITLDVDLDPAIATIAGDPHRLQQVVGNLLSNAVKFTPKQGRVSVVLRRAEADIEICVADDGVGITPDFLPYVFERFRQADGSTTRRFGGLGLGLSIVKHLTEQHGGTVGVHSDGEGKGATFSVRLPVLPVAGRSPPQAPRLNLDVPIAQAFAAIDLTGIRILVVDDETDVRLMVVRVLTDCGAEVRQASNALDALAMFNADPPQVLVTDIGMPDVDGYELLQRIRRSAPRTGVRIPAVALTAYTRSEDRTRALRAGFHAHVSKPVDPGELIAVVGSITGRTE